MGDSSMLTPSRPGLMICTPSLLHPGPENYATFLRWTRLHFRDLVDIAAIPGGKITRALQFITPGATGREGEYFNIIHASHHSIWSSSGYKGNSKRLDLENTRELLPGEEPVGCEPGKFVFDICNAVFSIYELVPGNDEGMGYHSHPKLKEGEKKVLVAINVMNDEEEARNVLRGAVREIEGLGKGEVYNDLYRHAGEEAQPAMHPPIEKAKVGGGQWLGLAAVVGGAGLELEDVRRILKPWKDAQGVKMGVWEEVVDVGETES